MQKTPIYKRCLWLMVALVMLALPALSLAEDYLVVKGGLLNLREEASTSSKVLGQYPSGTWMAVASSADGWSRVTVNGKNGYVMSKYLSSAEGSNTAYIRTNTGANLNLRTTPSYTGDIIASFANGGKVSVLIRGINWSKVNVNSAIGYMANKFLSGSASSGGTSTSGYPKTGVVNNPGSKQVLLLRDAPSTDAKVIGYYGNGVSVKLLGVSGNFYKVTVDGKNGYMMKSYIKVTSSSPVTGGFPATPFTAALKNPNGGWVVNFRKAPGMNTSIIKAYPVGTEITVLEVGENWSKVQIDGVEGYVSTYFFKAL